MLQIHGNKAVMQPTSICVQELIGLEMSCKTLIFTRHPCMYAHKYTGCSSGETTNALIGTCNREWQVDLAGSYIIEELRAIVGQPKK